MKGVVAIITLVVVVVIGSLKCNANKTELIVSLLERRSRDTATSTGVKLAIEAAKNSSELRDFFDRYEIIIDGPSPHYYTKEIPSNAIFYSTFALKDNTKYNGSRPLILLGPNEPDEASSVLNVVRFYKKLMVTYLTTTSEVTELKDSYGFTFAPTPFTFNAANFRLMHYFNWKRAAIVYDFLETGGLYVKVVGDLINHEGLDIVGFEAINTGLLLQKNINEDIKTKLEKLKELDAKIFLGEFNARGASLVFCELFKMGLYGAEFVWILHPDAGTVDDWYNIAEDARKKSKNKTKTCTKEQFQKAADGAFIFEKNILYRSDENTTTASGLTLREVFSKPDVKNLENSKKIEMATAFDTMWAIILALKEASIQLSASETPLKYNVENWIGKDIVTSTIISKLRNVSFEGLTGPISFTDNKEREGIIVVKQFQDGGKKLVPIGQHFTKQDKFVLFNDTKDSLWKGGRQPLDSSQITLKPQIITLELFVVFATTASIGILLGMVFLVFNRYYRKYKFIRLSAPLFNDVVVVGCILCLSTVFLFGLRDFSVPQTTMPPICKARAWILNIGFSLAFGGMFIKTWRIYKICTNKRLKVRLGPLSDWWMLAMVGGIVLIDVALLTAWEVEDPLTWKQYNFTEEKADQPFEIIIPTLNTCTSKHLTVWLALIYVYKGILLLYGLFLSYETRNVVYAHLNDSRVIGICVYNVVVLSTIGAFLALILNTEQYEQLYAALSVCITIPATATISLIFIPKLVHRVKMNSLNDGTETGETFETTINHTRSRPSIDISTTYYNGTEMGVERFVDASSTNTLCVHQNGEPGLSPLPSPTPPPKIQELSPKTLED